MVAAPAPETPFRKLQSAPNLVDQVVEQIRAQILGGEMTTGDSLPAEGKLAEQFGVSRTVVREAMHQLRSQGLVEVSHGRRPRVKAPNADASFVSLVTWMQRSELAIHQLLEVRRPIECEIAQQAAGGATEEQLDALQGTVDALANAKTLQERIEADAAFHRQLAEATGNPIFTLLLDAMAELLAEQRRRTLRAEGAARAAKDHQAILDAITFGDADAAQQAMADHLRWPREE